VASPRETVLLLEEIAANAVAATTMQMVGGWILRAWPDAPFRRPNSVLPIRGDAHGVDGRIAVVEDFYRRRALPVRWQIGPVVEPPTLEQHLAARGYVVEAPVLVQTAMVADVRGAVPVHPPAGLQLEVAEGIDDAWVSAYARAHGDEPAHARRVAAYGSLLARLGPRCAAAAARSRDGQPVASGFVVVERGFGGIFGMGTRPEARRCGVARALLHALATRAAELGATRLYLQVEADNAAALALYAGCGFDPAYGYHYRSLDLPSG
jgi:ribosomal protein S18 acetylase RimI-like enzyme